MATDADNRPILAAPAGRLPQVWDLLLQGHDAAEAQGQRERWTEALQSGELSSEGLFVAQDGPRIVGAVWVQSQPGAYALLIPPEVAPAETERLAERLLRSALEAACRKGVRLVQALLPTSDERHAKFLQVQGFAPLADLVYLLCLEGSFPATQPQPVGWSCRPYRAADEAALLDLLPRTYEGSLDCPGLAGLRSAAESLAGYAAVGSSGVEHWRLVEVEGRLAGCLLMADHPGDGPRELVYLGLVPEVRGRKLGVALSEWAQWEARTAGKRLLVLAVDVANAPALRVYAETGFSIWEQRRVFMKNLGSSRVERA
jgi:GNAT superfamily N-acetyltransferase